MKNWVVQGNDLIIFLVELVALYWIASFAYQFEQTLMPKFLLALYAVILFGILWGVFFSPKALVTMPIFWYFLLKTAMLAFPAILHYPSKPRLVLLYLIILLLSTAIQVVWGRDEWDAR